jgi:ABC-type sugar transport system ATPase subunit
MSDRILVMRQGRLVAQFHRAEATQEKIIEQAMTERQNANDVTVRG